MLDQGDEGRSVTDAMVARARAVMMRVATAAFAGSGPRVSEIPMLP
jgi:hypothetical protein